MDRMETTICVVVFRTALSPHPGLMIYFHPFPTVTTVGYCRALLRSSKAPGLRRSSSGTAARPGCEFQHRPGACRLPGSVNFTRQA